MLGMFGNGIFGMFGIFGMLGIFIIPGMPGSAPGGTPRPGGGGGTCPVGGGGGTLICVPERAGVVPLPWTRAPPFC